MSCLPFTAQQFRTKKKKKKKKVCTVFQHIVYVKDHYTAAHNLARGLFVYGLWAKNIFCLFFVLFSVSKFVKKKWQRHMWTVKPKIFIICLFTEKLDRVLFYAWCSSMLCSTQPEKFAVHGCFERSNYSWIPETSRILGHESFVECLFPLDLVLSLDQNNSKQIQV